MPPDFHLRLATPADAHGIAALIERAVHGLGAADYSAEQRTAAIGQVFLVDHGLIADGSYYVIVSPRGALAGGGGWSSRKAMHGGHVLHDGGERVDPQRDAARIRAYFVDPAFARQGVGSAILHACEAAARAAGFTRAILGATLTGAPFYARHGYRETAREQAPLPHGLSLTVIHMEKPLI